MSSLLHDIREKKWNQFCVQFLIQAALIGLLLLDPIVWIVALIIVNLLLLPSSLRVLGMVSAISEQLKHPNTKQEMTVFLLMALNGAGLVAGLPVYVLCSFYVVSCLLIRRLKTLTESREDTPAKGKTFVTEAALFTVFLGVVIAIGIYKESSTMTAVAWFFKVLPLAVLVALQYAVCTAISYASTAYHECAEEAKEYMAEKLPQVRQTTKNIDETIAHVWESLNPDFGKKIASHYNVAFGLLRAVKRGNWVLNAIGMGGLLACACLFSGAYILLSAPLVAASVASRYTSKLTTSNSVIRGYQHVTKV